MKYDTKVEIELTKDDIKCPDGWMWIEGGWRKDLGRAVDEDGGLQF